MITGYKIMSNEHGDLEKLYLTEKAANRHRDIAERRLMRIDERFGGDVYVDTCEVVSVPRQRVKISGNVAMYQFSRTTMGERTLRRTVRNLRWVHSSLQGEVFFKERILTVILAWDFANEGEWVAVDANFVDC